MKVSGTGYKSHQPHSATLAQDLTPCVGEKTLPIDRRSQNNGRHLLELVMGENDHVTQNNVIC